MSAPALARPWLDVPLPSRMRTLGWCLNAPGFGTARTVHWREVRDAEFGPGFDAEAWLAGELARTGRTGPCFVTSRDVSAFVVRTAAAEGWEAWAVATVGLSNAERIGARARGGGVGTINVLAVADAPLTDGAMVEASSLVAEARTAAVMAAGPDLPGGRATGTGTDCILVAALPGARTAQAGKHTAIGEALGRAVREAVAQGVADWMETVA